MQFCSLVIISGNAAFAAVMSWASFKGSAGSTSFFVDKKRILFDLDNEEFEIIDDDLTTKEEMSAGTASAPTARS